MLEELERSSPLSGKVALMHIVNVNYKLFMTYSVYQAREAIIPPFSERFFVFKISDKIQTIITNFMDKLLLLWSHPSVRVCLEHLILCHRLI